MAAARATTAQAGWGALGGVLLMLALSAERKGAARDRGFPAATSMILAATDRRLLVFKGGSFNRVAGFEGDVPYGRLRQASVGRQGLQKGLRFVLDSGAEVSFAVNRGDHPEEFAETVNRAIGARLALHPVEASASTAPVPPIPPPPTW